MDEYLLRRPSVRRQTANARLVTAEHLLKVVARLLELVRRRFAFFFARNHPNAVRFWGEHRSARVFLVQNTESILDFLRLLQHRHRPRHLFNCLEVSVNRLANVLRQRLERHALRHIVVQSLHERVRRATASHDVQRVPRLDAPLGANVDDELLVIRIDRRHELLHLLLHLRRRPAPAATAFSLGVHLDGTPSRRARRARRDSRVAHASASES